MGLGYGISWLLSPYSNRSIVGLSIKGLICLYYYKGYSTVTESGVSKVSGFRPGEAARCS